MADPLDRTFNLKHRLVGAIVLVGVAVILLPRVLTGTDARSERVTTLGERTQSMIEPSRSPSPVKQKLAKQENTEITRIELLEEPVATNRPADQTNQISNGSAEKNGTSSKEFSNVVNVPIQELTVPAESVVVGWIAQVGVFEDRKNAKRLVEKLAEDSIAAKLEHVLVEGSSVTRVLLGPFGTEAKAVREGNKAMMRANTKPIIKRWP